MFSFPSFVGLPGASCGFDCITLALKSFDLSAVNGMRSLLGELEWPLKLSRVALVGFPAVGASFMAFSKTSGRSCAPGGSCFLLGLPTGVAVGDTKPACVGVEGRSWGARVCTKGGGIGILKSFLLGDAVAAMLETMQHG